MINTDFTIELREIIILLKEHKEWQYIQPDKYESVRKTAINSFLNLIRLKTGVVLSPLSVDIDIESLRDGTISDAKRLISRLKRTLITKNLKETDPNKKKYLEDKIHKCINVEFCLK